MQHCTEPDTLQDMTDRFAIRMPPDVQSVQIGEHPLVFIDDFLEDPTALVDAACQARFEPYPGLAERKGYPGIRADAPADFEQTLTALVEPLVRLNFGVPDDLPLRKSATIFSLTTVPPEELGPWQRIPHFDASTPHHLAVLLYLCDHRHGGTAFYRHEASGIQRVTAANRERYLDAVHAELARRPPAPRYFDRGDDHFTFLGRIPAKFNRLVVYHGSLLHTACVDPARSIDDSPRTGRLTVNTFYDF